jgi:uncharacterized protein (TIGR03437 family)
MLTRFILAILAVQFACAGGVNYSYDAGGRLIKAVYANGSTITYTYDGSGNLLSRSMQTSSTMTISSVTTAFGPSTIAQNTWIVVKGTNLVPANTPAAGVIWSTAPSFVTGQMPTQLGTVSVTVNGKPGFLYFYCSAVTSTVCNQDQINVLTPLDSTLGPVQVIVTNNGASSPAFTADMTAISPAFLLFSTAGYVVATHLNNSLLGPTSLYPGSSTPAQPGEEIVLYAIGFGLPSNSTLTNGSSTQSGTLSPLPVCQIGGTQVPVLFAGLVGPGLYQFNVTVPSTAANGDNPVGCTYNGSATPAGDLVTVQQ